VAIALLANSLATGAALVALILSSGEISGAHFNPAVTCSVALQKSFPWRTVPFYVVCQIAGAIVGVVAAHVMFGLPALFASRHVRNGAGQVISEGIATLGLLLVIALVGRARLATAPYALARIYRWSLLVHFFHVVRESGGHARSPAHRHVPEESAPRMFRDFWAAKSQEQLPRSS
jgi:glycerol uptake facilitator-like aquaporin